MKSKITYIRYEFKLFVPFTIKKNTSSLKSIREPKIERFRTPYNNFCICDGIIVRITDIGGFNCIFFYPLKKSLSLTLT